MIAVKVANEIARVAEILRRRGMLYEDEQSRLDTLREVQGWLLEERGAAIREEVPQKEYAAPNTSETFRRVKINIPRKEL